MAVEWAPGLGVTQGGLHGAVRAIVLDALGKQVGETLVKNVDLRGELGVGVGTVQRALDLLADRGALQTVSRGHMGRRIEAVDLGQCWQAAGLAPVRVLMSPPGSVEIDSLEAWLSGELVRLGVPHTLTHVRGGNQRLDDLTSGASDLTVVSAGTFDGLSARWSGHARPAYRRLGPGSYYAHDRLLVLSSSAHADAAGFARIAIDRESFDHEALTLAEFPPGPDRRYIDVPFPEVPAFVLAGVADAGVWHRISSPVPLHLSQLRHRTMSARAAAVRDRLSGATIVARSERRELHAVVDALVIENLDSHRDAAIAAEAAMAARLELAVRQSAGS